MFVFRKIWRALFSWNTCFEIRPFALLPTKGILQKTVSKEKDDKICRWISYTLFLRSSEIIVVELDLKLLNGESVNVSNVAFRTFTKIFRIKLKKDTPLDRITVRRDQTPFNAKS